MDVYLMNIGVDGYYRNVDLFVFDNGLDYVGEFIELEIEDENFSKKEGENEEYDDGGNYLFLCLLGEYLFYREIFFVFL